MPKHQFFAAKVRLSILGLLVAATVGTASPAMAVPPPPGGDTPNYTWSGWKHYELGEVVECKFRTGWAKIDSNTDRVRYVISCNRLVDAIEGEFYIQRGNTNVVNAGEVYCGAPVSACIKTYDIANPAGTQTYYTMGRWYVQQYTNMTQANLFNYKH